MNAATCATSFPVRCRQLVGPIAAAHRAPSVGYMQPWRFLHIVDAALRTSIHALVDEERGRTAAALSTRQQAFLELKVEGLRDCAEVLVAALMDGREKHVFGRRTLPEMDIASTACAIQNMWLAARAEGIGLGWVSIFDPAALAALLRMPAGAKPIAVLCRTGRDVSGPALAGNAGLGQPPGRRTLPVREFLARRGLHNAGALLRKTGVVQHWRLPHHAIMDSPMMHARILGVLTRSLRFIDTNSAYL